MLIGGVAMGLKSIGANIRKFRLAINGLLVEERNRIHDALDTLIRHSKRDPL